MIDIVLFFGHMALQTVVGQGFLIIKALLSASNTRQQIRVNNQRDAPF